jgi:phosphotransferase system IIB component
MLKKTKIILVLFVSYIFLFSCQKTEFLDDIVFDNSVLYNLGINAEKKEIIVSYQAKLQEPFIDHVMLNPPTKRIVSWIEENISNFGTMNKLVINIVNASISRKEIETEEEVAGIVRKKNEYHYTIEMIVDYDLYSDDDQILATTKVKVNRSTTSSNFLSLNERNQILDNLVLESLLDLSNKSVELLKIHMSEFVL